ncbi:phosphoribosylformylglycinamidine synthase subunit PurL [Nakamurella multipartita]|uniref:Phosphoribosylformylglycinamidine synthase subunit PurL n=1 Tax=Nakamurella multipartita (strain ATCC 700099 / DSM 44233 / CIP 104796 / JCM 9543 / NBRC 105858 / Y-104) TaxID=479431 RepID=C8XB35_NAKMY|nr:phosphoribosylformylglycinamidine synthase subunit PurL [Nakamurella multipartita]ACV81327.1 phosphoribosylformylglycinamidine synthase II [Nakamurella multipartita DSM 44233]
MTDQVAHPTQADLLDITDPVGAVDLVDQGPELDTVARAAATPEVAQPYRELGLKDDEYARIREILGRRPTDAELAMYSVMWSEHCSYKSSKVHLAYFGQTTTPEMKAKMLAGIGENAGVVDIGDGWAVTFKIESHNHPSFVEPYQGAATGVGGIVRDILAMGARPVAVMDQLRFGPADAADSQRVVPGVVAGVSGYGNSLGLPNIGGEVIFDPSYAGNPLVNAACIGVLRASDLHTAHASGTGNKVILYGSRTGLDGIGGVSVLASDTFAGDSDDGGGSGSGHSKARKKLPSVQVGDPFAEKVLIECTLEVFHAGLVVGIQDLGGAGLSCATSELASAGDGGMHIVLDNVPLRAEGMTPAEILSSESQERMCAVVTPDKVQEFLAVCAKWEVQADVIGEVTDGDRLTIEFAGEIVLDVPPRSVAHDGPVYRRPVQRPDWQDALQADTTAALARPEVSELRELILRMVASPNLCSRAWVTNQYDRYVRGNTVLAQPADAGIIRVAEDPTETERGLAMATDCSGRYTLLDPYAGAQLALAEAYRNVVTTGAVPLAVTDCLNFGSPEDPAVMWQFEQAVRGLADGCAQLGIPVTGGNVSLYNQTAGVNILPTPVVGVLGVIDDVRRRTIPGIGQDTGETLLLLGTTRDEFDGSAWADVVHGHLGGRPPAVDLEAERVLGEILVAGSRDGMISAAHDVSEGGLVQTLVEMCISGESGARIVLPTDDVAADAFRLLFSESTARVVVAVPRTEELRFTEMCTVRQQPWVKVGVVDRGDTGAPAEQRLDIQGVATFTLAELRQAWEGTLPALFG